MTQVLSIVWFRQDLRLNDNPALNEAQAKGAVLPIYIHEQGSNDGPALGGASRWWLHHSLQALDDSLQGKLNLYTGDAQTVISDLMERFNVSNIYWNRCYEPWRIARDKTIKAQLLSRGINAQSFNGTLLQEPWSILKKDQTPYKIFTPYYRQACQVNVDTTPQAPASLTSVLNTDDQAKPLKTFSLLPKTTWDSKFYDCWAPGENGAHEALKKFLKTGIRHYKKGRDFPALDAISTLSPHLHFGEISPRQISHSLLSVHDDDNKEHFERELRWREFSYYLLYHWPDLPDRNLKSNLDNFPWENNPNWLLRWQQGATGYPLVDAGMRELWQTGFMHNRLRMITASFLIKNLLIDWRLGAQWFWDCLVDADLASNSASWQWVAGCGTDASPYFRIFNPTTQGEKFDGSGEYTKRFVPELKELPDKYLFRPWEAPEEVLKDANIVLGDTYPRPIVDVKESRAKALDAYSFARNT